MGLEQVADQYRQQLSLVGLSIAVGTPGCTPWAMAWGEANIASAEALTPEHALRAGSVTKSFTAALLLALADDGVLTLEDTIGQWGIDVPSADQSHCACCSPTPAGWRTTKRTRTF